MADLIKLQTFIDTRGSLTVVEKLPFRPKRIFYIYGVDDSVRGGHRHHKTIQAAFCIKGSCRISNNNGVILQDFYLDSPDKCLLLYPEDWHIMDMFTPDAILMVIASEYYDFNDYVFDKYE